MAVSPGPVNNMLDLLGVSHNLRNLMQRTAEAFEEDQQWADFDTFAYEAADTDSSFDLNEAFRMPQVLGGVWTTERLSLTGLGLFESRSAPLSCKTMFDLAVVCVERKV